MVQHKILVPVMVTFIILIAEVAVSFNSVLMPTIKNSFGISEQLAQMTVGISLFALGFAGVIYGGLADNLGRRPIFLFSMSFFCFTALIATIAPSIEIFLLARFLQGIGSGAGWVVGNACLRDVFGGRSYTQVMNYVHAVAGITPAVAPVIGSYLGAYIGWRYTFFILFIFSFLGTLLIYSFQPETLQKKKPICVKQILRSYVEVLRSPQYVRYLVVKVLTVMLIFTEVSNLPLIFVEHMNVPAQYYGFFIFPVLIVYVISTFLSSKLCQHLDIDRLIELGLFLLLSSNATLLLLHYLIPLSPILIQCVKALSYMGWAFVFGNATAQIVSAVPRYAGVASAMMIALEMLFSSLGIFFLSFFFNGTIVPLCWFMTLVSCFCLIFLRFYKREAIAMYS